MNKQRLHREPDPRVRRFCALASLAALVLVGAALSVVALRAEQVHVAYQLERLRADRARAETLIRQLEVQVATLTSPARLEQQARQLGLTTPGPAQVYEAREFVAGTSGLAAAHQARVEARAP